MQKKPNTKKQKTQKPNQGQEKKKMKHLTQLIKQVGSCKTKKCKEYVEKGNMINKEMFLALGWSYKKKNGTEVMSGFDPSKRDEKKIRKYQQLSRKNNKDLKKCIEDYCKKETDILNKFMKANLK